jgi:hypothetical protein
MKKLVLLIVTALFWIIPQVIFSQCTPDAGCIDDSLPGQICPDVLPAGTVDVPYNQVMTIIPPSSADIGTGTVDINKIVLTGIGNLPPGITFQSNEPTNTFLVGTHYCVLLSGTPTDTGTYFIKIITDVYIDLFGNPIFAGEFTDSTTYYITINPADTASVAMLNKYHFRMLPYSNPFSETDKIGVYSPVSQSLTLDIFTCLGQKVYSESTDMANGNIYFRFESGSLKQGVYIYSVSGNGRSYNGRLIISEY